MTDLSPNLITKDKELKNMTQLTICHIEEIHFKYNDIGRLKTKKMEKYITQTLIKGKQK